jgi:NADPH:quinone reductase-like Zn-dependent oxidoreductase
MKFWTMDISGRANLKLAEGPIPAPGPSEILVKVSAVALNYRDRLAVDEGLTMISRRTVPSFSARIWLV